MGIPLTIYNVCKLQLNALVPNASSSSNLTARKLTGRDEEIFIIAATTGYSLEVLTIGCIPVVLGNLFKGYEKIPKTGSGIPCSKNLWMLFLALISLLVGYAAMIFFSCARRVQMYGYTNTLLLNALPNCIHCGTYIFTKSSALLVSGSLITKLINKCLKSDENTIVADVKSCMKDYNFLRKNMGPLLLIFMFSDSLLVMSNSFMMYMACSTKFYNFMVTYIFWDLSEIFSLIFICILCDECNNALKFLLIPLRYT